MGRGWISEEDQGKNFDYYLYNFSSWYKTMSPHYYGWNDYSYADMIAICFNGDVGNNYARYSLSGVHYPIFMDYVHL